ncbi:MAG: Ig-like domain-containing protein [Gemmatimonadota bacterium]|nr:Ig-like domain-containing protein [Gemmatimonadota bacterium]
MTRRSTLRARTSIVTALWLAIACSGDPTAVAPRTLEIRPAQGLVVGVGGTFLFQAVALGLGGVEVDVGGAVWSTEDPHIATVDGRGLVTGASMGTTSVSVELGELVETARLEVYVPPTVVEYLPGASYFGRNAYVEYIPGELPVVLSAPHGGSLTPDEIADRTYGAVVPDRNTRQLTLAVREAFMDQTGYAPHVVISHLDRVKLDPNREIIEAAQGDPFAEQAWDEFHEYIERARVPVSAVGGGMYFDMHGHGHPKARLELGYLLSAEELNQADASLNSLAVVQRTSIREIGRDSPIPFSQLLRGPTSLGGYLESAGVPAVPSPGDPTPGDDPYFSGGYSTAIHGSRADTELVSGIQIEHHYPGLRDSDENRRAYAALLAAAVRDFMLEHFGYFEP